MYNISSVNNLSILYFLEHRNSRSHRCHQIITTLRHGREGGAPWYWIPIQKLQCPFFYHEQPLVYLSPILQSPLFMEAQAQPLGIIT